MINNPVANLKGQKGFTLLEMLVGIAIFILVISIVTVIFFQAIKGQRRSVQFQNVIDNSRAALEIMSRAIRMSEIIYPTGTVVTSSITLLHPTKATSTYSLVGMSIWETIGASSQPITGSNIEVRDLDFYIMDAGPETPPTPPRQWRVVITMLVSQPTRFLKPEEQQTIRLQTTITPRKLDL